MQAFEQDYLRAQGESTGVIGTLPLPLLVCTVTSILLLKHRWQTE